MPSGLAYEVLPDEEIESGFTDPATQRSISAKVTGGTKFTTLWQPVGPAKELTFRPSQIMVNEVFKKLKVRGPKGVRVWFMEDQLPAGWVPETVVPKYQCPLCPKKFGEWAIESSNGQKIAGSIQLDAHVSMSHPRRYENFKALIAKLVDEQVKTDRSMLVVE